jgi:RNA polymerase-binding transcription factor DksA
MSETARSLFTHEELAGWRRRLVDEARRLRAELSALDEEAVPLERVAPNHHLTEGASELQSQAIDGGEAAEAQGILRQIIEAIERIDREEDFGRCEASGAPIERERLELMPWTPWCAAESAAREHQVEGARADDG